MISKSNILTALLAVFAFACADAKVAIWSVPPQYQKLQRYSGDLYLFENNGKWGVVKEGGSVILSAKYDFITPIVNGYAVAGSKEGKRFRLESIFSTAGETCRVPDPYYLAVGRGADYSYFSEDKLVVINENDKYGYLDTYGNMAVDCQFDDALPFKEGFAPVKVGNYYRYITEDYDKSHNRNTLNVDFAYGELTDAGCFSDGVAPVAHNKKCALINKRGKRVKKIKEAEFLKACEAHNAAPESGELAPQTTARYTVYEENGKSGLKKGAEIILYPQFDRFSEIYSDGSALAYVNGRQGLLRIFDADIRVEVKGSGPQGETIEKDRKGNVQPVTVLCEIPGILENPKIMVDAGNGQLTDRTSAFAHSDNVWSLSLKPLLKGNSGSVNIRVVVDNAGVTVADKTQTLSATTVNAVSSTKTSSRSSSGLRVSKPGPEKSRANADGNAVVSSTIHNDSDSTVTVSGKWSNGAKFSVTVPAHGSKTVSTAFPVQKKFIKNVSISLNTGKQAQATITFIPYF